jgi:DNA-binding transcriptional LysR family regulator
MEIREIEAFLALADELHFSRAANRMDVSASRVSQLIQALERRVGGQLVRRDGHGVSLTEIGEQLLAGARPAYTRLEQAIASPVLRLGAWNYISGTIASELCAQFERTRPGQRAEWETVPYTDLYLPLQQHRVDVLMLLLPGSPGSLPAPAGIIVGPVLGTGDRVLLVAGNHPLAASPEIGIEDLASCQMLIVGSLPQWWEDAWHPPVTPSGRDIPRVRMPPTRDPDELFDYISRRGVAVIGPPWTLDDFFWSGLAAVPIRGLSPIHAVLASRDQADRPLVEAFLRVAAQTRLPFGHGKYRALTDGNDPGMCG